MGCDIHLFIENKNSKGQWVSEELSDNYLSSRNYISFSLLANVRNNFPVFIKTLHQNSGLPDDCSENLVKQYEDTDDYHSPHWITTKELVEIDYQSSILNWIDYSGYNKDYYSYPSILQTLFPRRKKMSKENALSLISSFCKKTSELSELTLADLVGEEFIKAVKQLYEKYPEGRLVFYFDN